MTRLVDLRNQGIENNFVLNMLSYDFVLGPTGFWFFRLRGDYIDYFDFWIKSSGDFTTIPVTCLKRSLIDHCDMKKFPKSFDRNIPIWGDSFINKNGIEIGSSV